MNNLNEMLLFTALGTIASALAEIVEDEEKKELLIGTNTNCLLASLKAKELYEEEQNGTRKTV